MALVSNWVDTQVWGCGMVNLHFLGGCLVLHRGPSPEFLFSPVDAVEASPDYGGYLNWFLP